MRGSIPLRAGLIILGAIGCILIFWRAPQPADKNSGQSAEEKRVIEWIQASGGKYAAGKEGQVWAMLNATQVSDLTPLSSLKGLTYLNVSGSQVSDLSPLAELPNLESLEMYNVPATDLSPLSKLASLKTLYLDDSVPRESIDQLKGALPGCQITVRQRATGNREGEQGGSR